MRYRVNFTLVADPNEEEEDCEELGRAEINMKSVLEGGDNSKQIIADGRV